MKHKDRDAKLKLPSEMPIEIILAWRDFQGQELCEIMVPAAGIKEPVLN